MTGEELVWYRIAERLKMSPCEAKAKHTATQFQNWQAFFDLELNSFHRRDYFFARVAYEVHELRATLCAIFGVRLPHMKVEDFLLKFEKREEIPFEEMDEDAREEIIKKHVDASKQGWFAGLGLDSQGKPKEKEPEPQRADPGPPTDPRAVPLGVATVPAVAKIPPQTANPPAPVRTPGKRRIIKPGGG